MVPPTLQQLSSALGRSLPHEETYRTIRQSKRKAATALVITDAIVLSAVLFAVVALRGLVTSNDIPLADYLPVIGTVIALNLLGSFWRGIYPGYGKCVIAELRSTFYILTGVFAGIIMISFFTRGVLPYARSILALSWMLSFLTVPFIRMTMRRILAKKEWFGVPVMIVAESSLARRVVDTMRRHANIGLRPFIIVEPDEHDAEYGYYDSVPVIGGMDHVSSIARHYGIEHAVIGLPHATTDMLSHFIEQHSQALSHLTFMGEHVHPAVIWISNAHTDLLVSAEVEQRLRQPALWKKKRLFDLIVTTPLFLLSLPIMAAVAIAIKLTSQGPVFYRQRRLGYKGRTFDLLKFRTMVTNADEALDAMLRADPIAAKEFERYRKLKKDPRVTSIGAILRRYSMDELPQLWNVLRGDMSLIGWRPLIPLEAEMVGKDQRRTFEWMYYHTRPGLTGLWQVSVRNEAEFHERRHIDLYYMRNWSLFLDLYIVLRTVGAVFSGRGAY
jgi:Undecaprenyl-phosphate galactose phosphotransferase WbaP